MGAVCGSRCAENLEGNVLQDQKRINTRIREGRTSGTRFSRRGRLALGGLVAFDSRKGFHRRQASSENAPKRKVNMIEMFAGQLALPCHVISYVVPG